MLEDHYKFDEKVLLNCSFSRIKSLKLKISFVQLLRKIEISHSNYCNGQNKITIEFAVYL